jgi:NAD(P)-dependent dehydrogenase (short-subunit alcohol dehydrogenase family)
MTEEPIRFDGQVAIVTGAGHGLGRSYATALASRGASVVCNDIAGDAARSVAEEIQHRGGRAVAETSSVAAAAGGEAIVRTAVDTFGSVDVVINNAGQLRNRAFEDMSVDEFDDVLRTHLAGAFYVTQPAYRHMKSAGYGRIVFTSSSAGLFGSPWQANYAAAKAGIVGLCNVVALEGAPHGITANAVMPMALTGIGRGGPPAFSPEQHRATVQALEPLLPYMTVDRVAPLVVYLASRRCAETRRVFSVGCGHVARVFIGVARGWYAPDLELSTPEHVASNLAAACDLDDFGTPESMNDESRFVAAHMPPRAHQPDRRDDRS